MINEDNVRRNRFIILVLVVMCFSVFYSVLSYRVINIPSANFNKLRVDVNVYSNDLVVITKTEEINVLDENVWYLFGETRYNTVSSNVIGSTRTTLQEYLKSLP
jgi:hypothetical protein